MGSTCQHGSDNDAGLCQECLPMSPKCGRRMELYATYKRIDVSSCITSVSDQSIEQVGMARTMKFGRVREILRMTQREETKRGETSR